MQPTKNSNKIDDFITRQIFNYEDKFKKVSMSNPSNPPLDEEVTQSLQAEGEPIDNGIAETIISIDPSNVSGCLQNPGTDVLLVTLDAAKHTMSS